MVAQLVVDCRCQLGEGPLWSVAEEALYWVDVPLPSAVHRWSPNTGTHAVFDMPEMVLSLANCANGGLLVASARRLNLFDPTTGTLTALIEPEPDLRANRINDGGTDAAGRFWFGTLNNNFGPNNEDIPITQSTGSLYSFDMIDGLRRHDQGIGAANTIAFSPDNRWLYFADTLTGWIYRYAFDLATGELGDRTEFARDVEYGRPDGSAMDVDGYLWNCRLGAGCVIRYAPSGEIDRIVEMPTRMVTSCAFGGPDNRTLFVTTARFYLSEHELADQPGAGGVFAVGAGVAGTVPGVFQN